MTNKKKQRSARLLRVPVRFNDHVIRNVSQKSKINDIEPSIDDCREKVSEIGESVLENENVEVSNDDSIEADMSVDNSKNSPICDVETVIEANQDTIGDSFGESEKNKPADKDKNVTSDTEIRISLDTQSGNRANDMSNTVGIKNNSNK